MRPTFRPRVERLETLQLLSDVSLTITADNTHPTPGTPVELTLTVKDVGTQNVTFADGPSGDGFTVSQNGSTVWRSNAGINAMFLREVTLTPGQTYTLQSTWDGHPNDPSGDTSPGLPTGTFQVGSEVSIDGVSADPLTITVGKASSAPTTGPTAKSTPTPTPAPGGGTVTTTPVTTPTTPVTAPTTPVTTGGASTRLQLLMARLAQQRARFEAMRAAFAASGHTPRHG